MQHTLPYLAEAESVAARTNDPDQVLTALRKLGLDDFGLLMISLPDVKYPALSKVLPRMASAEIQKTWTGASGVDLLKQTLAFTRIVENAYVRHQKRSLHDATIMDFGCGYGRILRMMYYYSNPDRIWGVDAWDKSLATSREAGMLGHLVQSERSPVSLPVGDTKFDLAFSLSVFTHLAPRSAELCLKAVRRHMQDGGLFILTIRPVEFWPYIDKVRGTNVSADMIAAHNTSGIAYSPHSGVEGETYGDTSLTFDFFQRDGWQFLGYDRSIYDSFQTSVILRAA
ncbi:MAG: class I SAM-dependent methyltransferase [Mesorhizobium sp.]|uniref:class I SAM-dependent methyltransferase n=1 Tax=Mesorhizobium sp. TaxID=1871066 RepID=UPI000FE859CB|nr:class I SAM-dependent methyltransferase [Mesorhizobium sp.]RWP88370.1 MAG: class I SAM-dependent methyltransferase [Mesorhizobium sp.]